MISGTGESAVFLLFFVNFLDLVALLVRTERVFFFRLLALAAPEAALLVLDGALRFFHLVLRVFGITTLCRNG